jgi:non-canonical purine NTP pyrophosphatase (RdgB/HAM1 family)
MRDDVSPQHDAIVCTGNAHKVEELDGLLPELALEPLPAGTVLPPEIGVSFLDNARIKAHAGAAMFPGRWVIADDSGLLVDSLDGRPGVRSARYAGEDASDEDNVRLLLRELAPYADAKLRRARFACVLVAVAPDGSEVDAEGTVEGWIAHEPRGDGGFGYDPVFVPDGHDSSFAQLGADVKARLSHRANAVRELRGKLGLLGGTGP